MIIARALRLCASLLLVAAPCFAAAIAPVGITPLATPADGYAESFMMVNDRGEVAGGAWAASTGRPRWR